MPFISPTPGDVHVNRPLTNLLIGYMIQDDTFVADRLFPNIPVAKQSDAYWEYDRGSWNRDEMKVRAPATESAGTTYDIGQNAYYASVRAVHHDIPDQLLANADEGLNLDRDATLLVSHKAKLNRELSWVARYFKKGVWAFNVDGVASSPTAAASFDPTDDANNNVLQWNDPTSTPIEDIRKGSTYVQSRTGYRPNVLAITRLVWDQLQDHPDIVARIDRGQTPNGPAVANREALARILEIDRVEVMEGIYNQAQQGNASAVWAWIGGKHAVLLYAAPQPGVMLPSAGYTFSWTGYLGAGNGGQRIKRFRMEHLAATRVEAEVAFDQKVTGTELGYFFNGIVA